MPPADNKPAVICLMGPTASGKTAAALELVQRHPFQIISVDSAQIYRSMDIGTGKPDIDTLAIAPHRLIDICDPAESYSASAFRKDVMEEISEVLEAGDTPLLVGGTMLYFKALRDGLADMPQASAAVREQIEAQALSEGWDSVHQRLASVDPIAAARIHPNDPQRLQRALEVYLVSGRTMTQMHAEEKAGANKKSALLPFNLHFFAIEPEDRSVLHKQIEQRFRQMLEQGLVAEVESLYRREDLSLGLPSMKSVGYRQVWQYLAGDLPYDDMIERSIIATRQLAKRQLTWLRSWDQLTSLRVPSAKSVAKPVARVLKFMDSISI